MFRGNRITVRIVQRVPHPRSQQVRFLLREPVFGDLRLLVPVHRLNRRAVSKVAFPQAVASQDPHRVRPPRLGQAHAVVDRD